MVKVPERPSWDEYFMGLARYVASRSNCCRRKVGAVVVRQRMILSTGYNGTPFGFTNCDAGGCPRCNSDVPPGVGYETCLCVHAEQNAISLAARNGTHTEGATVYCTLKPCFSCLKGMVQAGIVEVVYDEDLGYSPELAGIYAELVRGSGLKMRQVKATA